MKARRPWVPRGGGQLGGRGSEQSQSEDAIDIARMGEGARNLRRILLHDQRHSCVTLLSQHEQRSAGEGKDQKDNCGRNIYDDGSCDDPRSVSGGANGRHVDSSDAESVRRGRKAKTKPGRFIHPDLDRRASPGSVACSSGSPPDLDRTAKLPSLRPIHSIS
jgi:hypothetical protein